MTSITEINLIKESSTWEENYKWKNKSSEDGKMVKIGLFYVAGFSTGMLVNNMKIAAVYKGLGWDWSPLQAKLADYAADLGCRFIGPAGSLYSGQIYSYFWQPPYPIWKLFRWLITALDGEKLNLALSLLDKH